MLRSSLMVASLFAGISAQAEPLPTSGETIVETHEYLMESLPAVEAFELALASGERDRLIDLVTEDFHVVDRSDYDKKLKIDAFFDYMQGCKPTKRLNSNGASIGVSHLCEGHMFREVLYNVRDGRVSRIIIGKVPGLTIERQN